MLDHGIPPALLRQAVQLGAHNDCIVAGKDNMCEECDGIIWLVFQHNYGNISNYEALRDAILSDTHEEVVSDW